MNESASEKDVEQYLSESVREASNEGAIISNAQPYHLSEEDIHKLTRFYHTFSGEKKFQLIRYLCESNRHVKWTDMMFELKINPKSLSEYLEDLKSKRMIEHDKYGFRATEYGKESFESIENAWKSTSLK
jgi:predicted transcriptional regulator